MNSKNIEEKHIKSLDDFKGFIRNKDYRKWIYRGQSSASWSLESSLLRAIKNASSIREYSGESSRIRSGHNYEKIMLERFKSGAHLYLSHLPENDDLLSWLAVMQHHGAPTRLLDFSFSAYIALYFAVEVGDGDAAIYCIDHSALKRADSRHFGRDRKNVYNRVLSEESSDDEMCLFAFEPEFSNQRLLAQQGLFFVPNHLLVSHEKILSGYELPKGCVYKLVIGKELRYAALDMLNQMNITSSTVYPGLDGFCKNLHKVPVFGARHQNRVGKET
ncbi:FRG domain-containing protein [Vibrio penaeicida]|uniref:FRG domain-containing protein n=2 Tax=Vibrio penaeicida TaxID=104609 RepID=A0AAV5NTL6_9VIBR|nr:FRG domain-containing protein [Vibrio penaeicida]RTZ22971.1 FRG domain-containing protein [Vibrio penaeicida]GLQ74061.1 hypothetical protein GCM10007932_34220 [Vibrio penaeicida]